MSFNATEEALFELTTKLAMVAFGTLIAFYVFLNLFRWLKGIRDQGDLLKSFFATCQSFVRYTFPVFGCLIAFQVIAEHFSYRELAKWIVSLTQVFAVISVSIAILNWKEKVQAHFLATRKADKSLIFGLSRLATIAIILLAILSLLELFNYTPSTLLAFGGLGGLAISFAAKDMISNFFGGFMIHANRHFSVGDWIRSPNKGFEGFVEEVGWYITRLRTLDRRPLFIPNALITDAIIENPGRMAERRFSQTIGIRCEDFDKIQPIIDEIKAYLKGHKDIDPEKVMVHFVNFGPYSLDLEVIAYTPKTVTEEFRNLQQELLLKIGQIVVLKGAEMAYPTSVVLERPVDRSV